VSDRSFLAFDIGAGSGRAILGTLQDRTLSIEEVARFPNSMLTVRGHLHWNVFALFEEMKKGLAAGAAASRTGLESAAVDTWGVDFALLAADGSVLGLPFAYRDARTDGAMDAFFEIVPRERVYELTGIQFMQFNTLFQLFAMKRGRSPVLDAAHALLFMPDLFNYLLAGARKTDFTFATTSQLFNPRTRAWEEELFAALDVPIDLMQEIVEPGTPLGTLDEAVARETGAGAVPVIAAASHDTGSAVAAVPAEGDDWAYISSGTWSLMGIEASEPIINSEALALNFTNEGGVGKTIRFLKNICGLWLLEQCREAWAGGGADGAAGYAELLAAAEKARPFAALIDPDDGAFLNPTDMPAAIAAFCERTGQAAPKDPAAYVRAILESLALKYRLTLDQLRQVAPRPVNRLHVIGGGSRNEMLCQFTADATGLPVIAGPAEATAIGNIMVQALAAGSVASPQEMRRVIGASFDPVRHEPRDAAAWDAAYDRFRDVCGE
jgi:rhamnulokinase